METINILHIYIYINAYDILNVIFLNIKKCFVEIIKDLLNTYNMFILD